MRVLVPTWIGADADRARRNRWPERLAGKTVGLLDNTKAGAAQILEEVGAWLSRMHGEVKLVRVRKEHAAAPMSQADRELLRATDAVITGLGD